MGDEDDKQPRVIYAITEKDGRTFWTRIGRAFVNRDGSLTGRLDALPVSGQIQIRRDVPRDGRSPATRGAAPPPAAAEPGEDDIPF